MAWRAITRELYDALLVAFREKPGNYAHAATRAGCGYRMAKHGWLKGWVTPKGGATWAIPFSQVLKEEQEAAILLSYKKQEEERKAKETEREVVRQESLERRVEMLRIGKALRGTLGANVAAQQRVSAVQVKLMDRLAHDLASGAFDKMGPAALIKLNREVAEVQALLVRSYEGMDKIVRLEEGRPTEVIQVEDVTMEEALKEFEEAKALLELAQKEGLMVPAGTPTNGRSNGSSTTH